MPMTHKEVVSRLANGEHPVDLCIDKWERLIAWIGEGKVIFQSMTGASTCALCQQYPDYCHIDDLQQDVCPLYETQGLVECGEDGTLYSQAWLALHIYDDNVEGFVEAAQELISLLGEIKEESILPTGEKT